MPWSSVHRLVWRKFPRYPVLYKPLHFWIRMAVYILLNLLTVFVCHSPSEIFTPLRSLKCQNRQFLDFSCVSAIYAFPWWRYARNFVLLSSVQKLFISYEMYPCNLQHSSVAPQFSCYHHFSGWTPYRRRFTPVCSRQMLSDRISKHLHSYWISNNFASSDTFLPIGILKFVSSLHRWS